MSKSRALPREISDQELADLDFENTKCTTCTPCCMNHAHFLHNGKVLWVCQTKLKKRAEQVHRP